MKPVWTAALIPLRIIVASVTKIDDLPKLNAEAWMNFPSQSRMMNPPAAPCDDLDPSKLILMNPPRGFFHATQYVFFRLVVEIIGFGS